MRHTTARPRTLGASLLLALGMVLSPGTGWAEHDNGPRPNSLVVTINGTIRLQTSSRKPIKTASTPKENVVNIRTVPGDPTTVLLVGVQPDVTHVELTDVDGKTESYEVIVQADIEYLRTQLRRAVPTANITPIPMSNRTVILAGTVSRAEDVNIIRGLVQSVGFLYIDAMRVGGVQQVQLDVIVASVSRAELRSIAHNFIGDGKLFYGASTVGAAVAQPATLGLGAPFTSGGVLASSPGSPNGNPTNLLFGVLHNSYGLQNYLACLRNENLAKLIAEPRLITSSGRPASFLAGGEQAIPVPAGLGQVGVQFEEYGTRLNFIPIVLGNGKIRMEVEPEVSTLSSVGAVQIQGATVQGRVTNRINTTVELEAGQTFVIGGLIQHQVTASTARIPFLGDLPFVGWLFSSKIYSDEEQELLVLVTPWLVDPMSCDQRPKILPGMETRKPDDFELFLEGIIEAPRGQRQAFQHGKYVPAYKSSPSAAIFPTLGGAAPPEGGMLAPLSAETLPANVPVWPTAGPVGAGPNPSGWNISGAAPVPGAVPGPVPGTVPGAVPAPGSVPMPGPATPAPEGGTPAQPMPQGTEAAPLPTDLSAATGPAGSQVASSAPAKIPPGILALGEAK